MNGSTVYFTVCMYIHKYRSRFRAMSHKSTVSCIGAEALRWLHITNINAVLNSRTGGRSVFRRIGKPFVVELRSLPSLQSSST